MLHLYAQEITNCARVLSLVGATLNSVCLMFTTICLPHGFLWINLSVGTHGSNSHDLFFFEFKEIIPQSFPSRLEFPPKSPFLMTMIIIFAVFVSSLETPLFIYNFFSSHPCLYVIKGMHRVPKSGCTSCFTSVGAHIDLRTLLCWVKQVIQRFKNQNSLVLWQTLFLMVVWRIGSLFPSQL